MGLYYNSNQVSTWLLVSRDRILSLENSRMMQLPFSPLFTNPPLTQAKFHQISEAQMYHLYTKKAIIMIQQITAHYRFFDHPTPNLPPDTVHFMCVVSIHIFHHIKTYDFDEQLFYSIIGLIQNGTSIEKYEISIAQISNL